MIEVSQYLKDFFMSENSRKSLIVKIGEGSKQFQLAPEQIVMESMELTESLSDDENLELVGCNASMFKIQVAKVAKDLEEEIIEVSVDVIGENPIPLFHGVIESADRTANKRIKEIIAYDRLYELSQRDVKDWFNTVTFPLKMKNFRADFFEHIGLDQTETTLGCDEFILTNPKEFVSKNVDEDLTALDVLKNICQMEGKFGIINRYGKFEYRSLELFEPANNKLPQRLPFILKNTGKVIKDSTYFPSYRSVDFSDFAVKNIKTVIVKQEESSDIGGYAGYEGRRYKVYGNIFTRYSDEQLYEQMAECIQRNIKNIEYTPFESVNIGLPFLEVGDAVQFYAYDFEESEKQGTDVSKLMTFVILKRTLKGIMSMTDNYSAKGQRGAQSSDFGWKNKEDKQIEKRVEKNENDIKDLQDTAIKVESVKTLPASTDANTIYLIQGTVG